MTEKKNPAKPTSNDEKFKPQNVADGKKDSGRNERDMVDVARGSEPDRLGGARNRT